MRQPRLLNMKFDYNRIRDPGYYAENRVSAHSDHVCYASVDELAAGQSSLRLSLNGPWKFHYALNIGQAPEGFEAGLRLRRLGGHLRAGPCTDGGLRRTPILQHTVSLGRL